jgi:hypothetical protein
MKKPGMTAEAVKAMLESLLTHVNRPSLGESTQSPASA